MEIIVGAIGVVLFLGLVSSIPATLIVEREQRNAEHSEQG